MLLFSVLASVSSICLVAASAPANVFPLPYTKPYAQVQIENSTCRNLLPLNPYAED